MSPRYCPPHVPTTTKSTGTSSSSSSSSKYPRQPIRQKTAYTNFSRAPRFSWQKRSPYTKSAPLDITHKSRVQNYSTGPSPCSYDVPTNFSPYTEEKRAEEERRRRETKNSSSSSQSPVSKKLNLDNVARTEQKRSGGVPPPGIIDEFQNEDEVSDFVKSSVKGKTFKMWEDSPSGDWKDKQGYSRTGRWVTVRSKEDKKKRSQRKGIEYVSRCYFTC